MAKQKILVLVSGERLPITGERGKYWLTEGQQFRKLSGMIRCVEELPDGYEIGDHIHPEDRTPLTMPDAKAEKKKTPDKLEAKKKKPSKSFAAKQQKSQGE